jgi:hypothetical protein
MEVFAGFLYILSEVRGQEVVELRGYTGCGRTGRSWERFRRTKVGVGVKRERGNGRGSIEK